MEYRKRARVFMHPHVRFDVVRAPRAARQLQHSTFVADRVVTPYDPVVLHA